MLMHALTRGPTLVVRGDEIIAVIEDG